MTHLNENTINDLSIVTERPKETVHAHGLYCFHLHYSDAQLH